MRTFDFDAPMAAHYNPIDGSIYVGRRGSSADGLYRIEFNGFVIKISGGSNVAAVMVDPVSGDDDPIGMAIAPLDYTGSLLPPGEALAVDRGNSGLDENWRWSPTLAEGETALHTDVGVLIDALDVAIDHGTVFVVDSELGATGTIYTVAPDSALVPFTTTTPIANPAGLVIDPLAGDLLIYDQTVDPRIVRVARATGEVSNVLTGLGTGVGYAAAKPPMILPSTATRRESTTSAKFPSAWPQTATSTADRMGVIWMRGPARTATWMAFLTSVPYVLQ